MVFKKVGNWFNKNVKLSSLLESKIVLYLLVIISLGNLYSYAMDDEIVYAAIMIIVGFLCTFFNKNMIIILFIAISITNVIRFSVEGINTIEGFSGDVAQLDNLMDHLTGQENKQETQQETQEEIQKVDDIPLPEKLPENPETGLPDVPEDMLPDKNAVLNKDPSKRDAEIDKFLKKLNLAGTLNQLEGKFDVFDIKKVDLVKEKTDIALKYTNQIAHVEQRKGVESLLRLQRKLLDQLITIAPLIDEFREVVKYNNF